MHHAVINAYVQTNNPDSALRAEQLLMKMIKLSKNGYSFATPNVISYTTGKIDSFFNMFG